MFDPIDENQPLSPLVADAYTDAERRANAAEQLRDRFGRWVDMGRGYNFKYKFGGRTKSTTGVFVGPVPNRPGYGLILMENDPDFGNAVVEVNMKSGQAVLAKLSRSALRKAGVVKAGHDVNGNPIGDVLDVDIEDISVIKRNDITDIDREFAKGNLTEQQKAAIKFKRATAPRYESTNVVAETEATKEDLGEGYQLLQEALGRTKEVQARDLKPGDTVILPNGDEKEVDKIFSTDSGPMATFKDGTRKVYSSDDKVKVIPSTPEKEGFERTDGQPFEDTRLIPKPGEGLPFERFNRDRPLDPNDPNVVKLPSGSLKDKSLDSLVEEKGELDKYIKGIYDGMLKGDTISAREFERAGNEIDKISKEIARRQEKDSAGLARELNDIAGRRSELDMVVSMMRRFGSNPEAQKEAEARLAELDAQYEAKLKEYEASLPDTSKQDAIDERERLKSELQWYDNEQGDVARKIDEGVSGPEILDWLRENSAGWREAESDLATSWNVDLPRREQRQAWAKFEKLRSDLEGYNVPPSDGDATPVDSGGNDRNRVYKELSEALGIDEAELRNAANGQGSDQARRIADSIEYFGDLIDKSKGDKNDLYGRLSNVLKQDVENAKTNTPAVGPEVVGEPQDLIERVAKEEGGTVDARSGNPVKSGIAVGLRGRNEELVDTAFFDRELGALAINDFLAKNVDAINAGNKLGLWHDKENREVTLDISKVFDEYIEAEFEKAKAFGKENNQQGIFGIEFRGYIDTGGTGDRGRARRQREESRLAGQGSNGPRPEGLGEPVGGPEDGTVEADLRQSDGEHPEEAVEFTDELGEQTTQVVGEVRDYVSVLGSPDVDISEDKTDIIETTSEIDSAVEKKDGNLVMRGIRSLVSKISALRGKLNLPEDSEDSQTIDSLASRLIGVRNFSKRSEDAVDNTPTTLSESEIAQEIEIPENIDSNIFDSLKTPEGIDYSKLTESQAKLLKTLIGKKNAAILGMSNAKSENSVEKFNRQYLIARLYSDRVKDLIADVELRGDKADIFGGIDNRIRNLKVIESSIVRGLGNSQDNNAEVIKNFKALFVGKSGTLYELDWDYNSKVLNVYSLGPDGRRQNQVAYQNFSNGGNGWHFDSTEARSLASIFYENRYGRNKKYVTTTYVLVQDSKAKGDGLGGIMALASQYAIEGAGRKFQHSLHLLVDGNRNSKIVNGHDPDLHHPSQVEKLLETKGSKIAGWLRDLGWIATPGNNDPSKQLLRDLNGSRSTRSFEHFFSKLGVVESFSQEGPIWHLNGLLRQHANLFREGFKYNPSAKDSVPVPSIYKKFVKSKTSQTNPDFDLVEIVKELGFEGGISKKQAIKKLTAIRDSIQEAGNTPFPDDVRGFRKDIMDSATSHLTGKLTELIDKIESEEFTDKDKISRRKIVALDEVKPVQLDVLSLKEDPRKFGEVSKDLEKLYSEVEKEIPPAPRNIGGEYIPSIRELRAGGPTRILEEDVNPRDLSARIAPTVEVRPRAVMARTGENTATPVTIINESHVPTVSEEEWRAGAASDDPRVIARNFSTNVLRQAYSRAVFPQARGQKATLRYQDGATIEVSHAALRDALQMQGENTDAILNQSLAESFGAMYGIEDLPSEAVLKSEASYGTGSRRDYVLDSGNRSNLAVITYEDKDSNGTVALIADVNKDNPEAGAVVGRVVQNPNGTYSIAVAREGSPAVAWPADAEGLSNLNVVASVSDRDIALMILEQEAQRRFSTNTPLISEINREEMGTGVPILEVENADMLSNVREVRFGVNGQSFFIRKTDLPSRNDVLSIVNAEDITTVGLVEKSYDSATNTTSFVVRHYMDVNNLPEGAYNFARTYNNQEDAVRALGELFGITNGATVNPLTNEPIRSLDELPNARVLRNPAQEFTSNERLVTGGSLITRRGGVIPYTAQNLPDGPEDYASMRYITGVSFGSQQEIQINYGQTEGKFLAIYRNSAYEARSEKEFDSYAEALEFSNNWLKTNLYLDNPEEVLTTRLNNATPEEEQLDRVQKIALNANSDPVEIDDSYTIVSNESMNVTEASNPVRVYRDADGNFWVVKRAAHTMFGDDFSRQIDMEIFASAVYRAMGVDSSDIRRASIEGDDNYLISPFIFRSQENVMSYISEAMESGDQSKIDSFRRGIALDLLMNNIDVYFNPDNMVVGGDGKIYRVDNGSALFYTPSGRREAYGAGFTESASMEEILNLSKRLLSNGLNNLPYPNYGSVSGANDVFDRDSEDMRRYVREVVSPLTDEALEELVSVIRDDVDRQRTLDTLKYRRDGMLEYYGVPKLGEDRPFASQVNRKRLDEAQALGMPEGYLVIRRPEEDSIQIEHSGEEDGIPHAMATIVRDSENGSFDVVNFNRSVEPVESWNFDNEADALNKAAEFINQAETEQTAPAVETPQPEVPAQVAEVAPRIQDSPRLRDVLSQPQIVLNAVKQAFAGHQVLPNGDILVSSRDFQGRSRGDNRVFRYEVVLHKTPNDDFVAYVRQYQIDGEGNQVGDVKVGRFTDKSHSPEVTVTRVRALLNGNTSGRGINGTNPNNWFNNSSDIESESVDPANDQPLPNRFVEGRQDVEYIGDTGIPKTGNGALDALIQTIATQISVIPEGKAREEFVKNLLSNLRGNPVLSGSQAEDVIERILANRETPGVNMVPYPSRDGRTIIRVGDKVKHVFNGVEKIGYVTKRTRITYKRPSGEYSYEDVVYVNFPGARGGSTRITTKNLEVISRADGSAPLPVDSLGNAVQKPSSKGDSQQLNWQDSADGRAYLGAQGKTSAELEASASGYIEPVTMPDGAQLYKIAYRDSSGILRSAYYDANLNTIDEIKQILQDKVRSGN